MEDDGQISSSEGSTIDITINPGESMDLELEESMDPEPCCTTGSLGMELVFHCIVVTMIQYRVQ